MTGIFSFCNMQILPERAQGRGRSVRKGFQSEELCGPAGMSIWLALGISCVSHRGWGQKVSLPLRSWFSRGQLGDCPLKCGKGYKKRCTAVIGSCGRTLRWVWGLGRPPWGSSPVKPGWSSSLVWVDSPSWLGVGRVFQAKGRGCEKANRKERSWPRQHLCSSCSFSHCGPVLSQALRVLRNGELLPLEKSLSTRKDEV